MFSRIVLIFLITVLRFSADAQQLKEIQSSFERYQKNSFHEKLFAHLAKDQYIAGEIIWFKLYNVEATSNQLLNVSKVAYIELLDQQNKPIVQSKIALKNGMGWGSISVPHNIASGNYKFRAYTNWMKNFDPSLYFEKQLPIVNTSQPFQKPKALSGPINLSFFPEGGDLVEGITSIVGFKAIGVNGRGIAVKGAILNQSNDTVARFQSLKFGIGKFPFKPIAGQNYRSVLVSTRENVVSVWPIAKKEGYVISLSDEQTLTLKVESNITAAKQIYLLVHTGGVTTIAEAATLNNGKATFSLNRDKFGDGIAHLTVFDDQKRAVGERLYFKKPTNSLQISVASDLRQYALRQKVNVNLNVTDQKQVGVPANLSLAVKRLDSLQGMDQADIASYLLLSAELKGNIESARYYLSNETPESKIALDNLLLTQGWRRFAWNEIISDKAPTFAFIPELDGHLIRGKITDRKGQSLKFANAYLGVPGEKAHFYESMTDKEGNLMFNTKNFYGNKEIVVQTNSLEDTTSTITILSPFSEQYSPYKLPNLELTTDLLSHLTVDHLGIQLQHVYNEKSLYRFQVAPSDTSNFYGKPFKTYKFSDYTRFKTMEETLRAYVTETFVSKTQNDYHVRLLGKDVSLNGDPVVLLDGVPYFDMNKLMAIDPNKIEKLEILPEVYHYGSSTFTGILSLTSFKPSLANMEINPKAIVVDYDGMQLQREFYSPSYDDPSLQSSRIPDFRNLLFWNPTLTVGSDGKLQQTFYTSDLPGTYIGVVYGLSNAGLPGAGYFIFQVKEQAR